MAVKINENSDIANTIDLLYCIKRMVTSKSVIISMITSHISNDPKLDLCILYGSAALGRLSAHSDVDIAVGSVKKLTNNYCLELSRELTLAMDREVSVIDIDKMEGVILQEVLTKGITLKNGEPNYKAGLIVKMYEFTEDILPFQMMGINKKVAKFLNG